MWTESEQPFGVNHAPLLTGLSALDDGTDVPVAVNPNNGAIFTSAVGGLTPSDYDAVALTQTSLTDVYTFYTGGLSGTIVDVITITYTDSTKATLANVVSS